MKSSDIRIVLEVNPEARFALKPTTNATVFGEISGLTDAGERGWHYTKAVRPRHPLYKYAHAYQICTVEDAQREVDATIARNAARCAAKRKAEIVARELNARGVESREALNGRIIIDGVDALAALLNKVPT